MLLDMPAQLSREGEWGERARPTPALPTHPRPNAALPTQPRPTAALPTHSRPTPALPTHPAAGR